MKKDQLELKNKIDEKEAEIQKLKQEVDEKE
jgi:hypothetical protein